MTIYEEIAQSIERQFEAHSHTNLFYQHHEPGNQFLPESKKVISSYRNELLRIAREHKEGEWIDMMTDKARQTFCRSNQFIDLRQEHLDQLREVYEALWCDIIEELGKSPIDFDRLQQNHLDRLKTWLKQTNNFVTEINKTGLPEIVEVVCAEYSASLQLQLLHIDVATLLQPVLDLGCGEHAHLTRYLQKSGINAFGMDRIIEKNNEHYLICSDWLDYPFVPDSWGSIISNHSFALHFSHQNLRKDGSYIEYAKKYIEILHSLQPGGSFYYTPSLPFIEQFLPDDSYSVITYPVTKEITATRIIRQK